MPKQGTCKAKRDGVINPKYYNNTEFSTRKIWCSQHSTNQPKSTVQLGFMCLRGLLGPPAVTLTSSWNSKNRLLLRCIHHFKSGWIYNMDHMRISGTEPSSVSLSQTKRFKIWRIDAQECQNKVKPKRMVKYTHNITVSRDFQHGKFDALNTLRINRSRP